MLLLIFQLLISSAKAVPGGCSNHIHPTVPISKIMQVDDPDRRTEEKYAEENFMSLEDVQVKFGASGTLVCRNDTGSGQVTVSTEIGTTAAHLFYTKKCKLKNDPAKCSLVLGQGGKKQVLEIEKVIATGFKCPPASKSKDDWAVIKFKRPAMGVSPYALPSNPKAPMFLNKPIILAASGAVDFAPKGPDTPSRGNCLAKHAQSGPDGSPVLFSTNCDSGSGFSGGAVLAEGDNGVELVGIVLGGDETSEQEMAAVKRGTVNKGDYKPNRWETYAVPVSNELYQTLEKLDPMHRNETATEFGENL